LWSTLATVNTMIGQESDLLLNWNSLLDAAGLTPEERTEAEAAYMSHVHSFRVASSSHCTACY
jgi:hypothetical protein